MGVSRAIAILGGAASIMGALAACDGGELVQLHPAVAITPAQSSVVVWRGFPAHAPLTLSNTGPVGVAVKVTIEGVPDGLLATLDNSNDGDNSDDGDGSGGGDDDDNVGGELDLERGTTRDVDVALAADAPPGASGGANGGANGGSGATLAADLVVTATPTSGEGTAATASIHVEVRTPPVCAGSDPCDEVHFDPEVGDCVHVVHPDGERCDDGSLCTDDDRCSSGRCVGPAVVCHDEVDCTVDTCDPLLGCAFLPVNERCADDNACTDDRCDVVAGCVRETSPDGTPCGAFSCDSFHMCVFGACIASPTPDGFPCEDGDLCTAGDTCSAHVCISGATTVPIASAPAVLARPVVHVEPDVRMFTADVGDITLVPPFDVTPDFGAVLDVTQALVGFSPTLAVLWRTAPFGFDGPCSPWDPLSTPAELGTDAFCGTALVVTFADEQALLANDAADGVGTSVVLGVMYGTVGATFKDRAREDVSNDAVDVVAVESTYTPRPDGFRELRIHDVALSFSARAVVAHDVERNTSGPFPALESNVHEGMRVAADDGGVAFLGWDLAHPVPFTGTTDPDGASADKNADEAPNVPADPNDPEPGEDAIATPMQKTLDVGLHITPAPDNDDGLGAIQWVPLFSDKCEVGGAPPSAEEVTFADVQITLVKDGPAEHDHAFGIVRHGALPGETVTDVDGCVVGESLSFVELTSQGLLTTFDAWPAVARARVASLADGAEVLASVSERINDCAALPCPLYALDFLPTPYDTLDPAITLRSFDLDDADATAITHIAALASPGGILGAVVVSVGADGAPLLRLIDRVDRLGSDGQVIDLARAVPTPAAVAHNSAGSLAALRSPLSPQSVYAVTPANVDANTTDGVVVRFGCPFPTPP